MGVKRLEVRREIIPDLARVAVLWTNRADAAEQLRETDRAARALGIAIVLCVPKTLSELMTRWKRLS